MSIDTSIAGCRERLEKYNPIGLPPRIGDIVTDIAKGLQWLLAPHGSDSGDLSQGITRIVGDIEIIAADCISMVEEHVTWGITERHHLLTMLHEIKSALLQMLGSDTGNFSLGPETLVKAMDRYNLSSPSKATAVR